MLDILHKAKAKKKRKILDPGDQRHGNQKKKKKNRKKEREKRKEKRRKNPPQSTQVKSSKSEQTETVVWTEKFLFNPQKKN